MAPVQPLEIYDERNHDKVLPTPVLEEVTNQYILQTNKDSAHLDVIKKLIANKTAEDDNHPFFVMSMDRISGLLENWYAKLPGIRPFYTMRCNSDVTLLKLLTGNSNGGGVGLCCSSRSELELAMKYVDQERIIYANTIWTRANIRSAKDCGVQTVIIESEDDLNRFAKYFPEVNLILRVIMDPRLTGNEGMPAVMNDGMDVEKAASLLRMTKDSAVKIIGISISVRSDCPSSTTYSYAVAQSRRLFDIGIEMGHKMTMLDVGNAFPNAVTAIGLTFEQIARSLRAAFSLFFPPQLFGQLEVIAEPGAYFATSAYSLVTCIIDKRMVDACLLTTDESDLGTVGYVYQINEGFYGAFGCRSFTRRNPTCFPVVNFGEKLSTYAAIVGPEPCDTDIVLPLTRLPPLQVGDWLIWHDMGAYTMGNSETLDGKLPSVPVHYYKSAETKISVPNFHHVSASLTDSMDSTPDLLSSDETDNDSVPFDELSLDGANAGTETDSCIDTVAADAEQLQGAAFF